MLEDVANTVGSEHWASAGMMFHETRMWVGMLKFNISDTPQTYTDVSVDMGPFCPNVRYRPAIAHDPKKEGGLVDKLVEVDKADEGGDDRNAVSEQIVANAIKEGTSGIRIHPKFKREEKANDNKILKTGSHDLLSLVGEYLRSRPTNHDLLTLIRQDPGNLQELERHEIYKANIKDLLSYLRQKGVNQNDIFKSGGLLTLLRKNLGDLPENGFLDDRRVPPNYEYLASNMSLLQPFNVISVLSPILASFLPLFLFY